MKPLFIFDLDSTITKCELLPLIAGHAGIEDEMRFLTETAMSNSIPFEQDFRRRVASLKNVPISTAQRIAAKLPLHEEIARFIRQNPQRCRILTGNLDVWIAPIIEKLMMTGRCCCSHALAADDRLLEIISVLNKESECFRLARPFVAIGDGSNDIGMLKAADIGIAFGGARKLSAEVIASADMVVQDERDLVSILQKML